ncbi:hypothetical protein, partial [Escherichia coli]|uniref:hypothetical protein n=1 Tax=Escherichia coli TaxID=562 RepID=UPI0028A01DC6
FDFLSTVENEGGARLTEAELSAGTGAWHNDNTCTLLAQNDSPACPLIPLSHPFKMPLYAN